jgi:ATP-dependent DNA ligase
MCANDDWRAEQKLDGKRLIVEIEGDELMGINREGKVIRLDDTIANSFEPFSGQWTFDGELMADGVYWIFDMPRAEGKIDLSTPYEERRETLNQFYELAFKGSPYIKLLPSYSTSQDKIVLARDVLANNGEGVMLKRRDAPYPKGKEGKPNRTRNNMKWKFVKTVDCVIGELQIEGRQNVGVRLLDPETSEMVEIGTVGMTPGNLAKAKIGDVVEVKYLYVENPQKPRLTQPSFIKFRDDKSAAHCWMDQIQGYTNKSVLTGLSS